MATNKSSGYWFPRRGLHVGHFPLWTWLFPPFWLILIPVYLVWAAAILMWFVISIPVNIIRLATNRKEPPAARYDPYTGERLAP